MTGSPREVLDWIAYMQLIDRVHDLCDSRETALVVMPCFLRGDSAAERGRQIVGVPTVEP